MMAHISLVEQHEQCLMKDKKAELEEIKEKQIIFTCVVGDVSLGLPEMLFPMTDDKGGDERLSGFERKLGSTAELDPSPGDVRSSDDTPLT